MFKICMDILVESLHTTLVLIPYLYLTYLALEYLEYKTSGRTLVYIKKSGKYGPFVGGILGMFPQCGFSVAAANLFATGLISIGTLFAIFISTSDEMLPLLISGGTDVSRISLILCMKVIFAIIIGFLIEYFLPETFITHKKKLQIKEFCKREKCLCESKNTIWKSALKHTEKISLFIFMFSLLIDAAFAFGGRETVDNILINFPIISKFVAAAVGLIPSCYPSVLLTQLYLDEAITMGTMLAGTISNAGLGFLVLSRVNPNVKENLRILLLLYICGVVLGILSEFFA